MQLVILTPEQEVYNGTISSIKVPGINGEFEILNNHAPIVSALSKGTVRIIKDGGERVKYTINSGFIEVLKNQVSLLAQGLRDEE